MLPRKADNTLGYCEQHCRERRSAGGDTPLPSPGEDSHGHRVEGASDDKIMFNGKFNANGELVIEDG